MKTLLNTLYVQTQGAYLHLDHETLRVKVEGRFRLQVPLHHLGAIVVFGDSLLSPALMGRCAADGRSVTWLSFTGRFLARLEGPASGNVLLRRAQHAYLDDSVLTLEVARHLVAGKVKNQRTSVLRSARATEKEGDREALGETARRKKVVVAYQERKQEEVFHHGVQQQAPLGMVPHLQARLLARHLRGELVAYPPYLHR